MVGILPVSVVEWFFVANFEPNLYWTNYQHTVDGSEIRLTSLAW